MEQQLSPGAATALALTAIVAAVLAVGGVFAVGQRHGWGRERLPLTTEMANVQGLRTGTAVRLMGMDVGEVVAVRPPATPDGAVRVDFWIDAEHRHLVRTDATTRLMQDGIVGERSLEILPGTSETVVQPGAALAAADVLGWEDLKVRGEQVLAEGERVLGEVNAVVADVRSGKGTVGRLLTEDAVYDDATALIRDARTVLDDAGESYSSAKQNWLLSKLVTDRFQLLVRPDMHVQQRVFPEDKLFEPGEAKLTQAGRIRLDSLVDWIRRADAQNGELLVAGFHQGTDPRVAEIVSRKQAEAVLEYLTDAHDIHVTGWLGRRTATAHGFGADERPGGAGQDAPADRVEVLVYTPQPL